MLSFGWEQQREDTDWSKESLVEIVENKVEQRFRETRPAIQSFESQIENFDFLPEIHS